MISNCYMHSAYRAANKGLRRFVDSREGRLTQRALLLLGPAGTGKSTLINNFFRTPEFEAVDTPLGLRQPAIIVEAPSRGTVGALSEVILAKLNDKNPQRGNVQAKMARMFHNLLEQKVGVIVIDEVDQLTLTNAFAYADYLKSILNQSRSRLVLVGLETALSLPRANDQLARRCDAPQLLNAFDWFKLSDRSEFKQILEGIQNDAPSVFAECPISDPTLAAAINFATEGSLGFVDSLLTYAVDCANDDERDQLTIADLAQACDSIYQLRSIAGARINPFRDALPLQWRPLPSSPSATTPRVRSCTTKAGAR
ncbi:MAG: TniB family NTP-binding protein [Rhodospirillaceae bacterium]|nr:TniB family NTP-binding protein [Rhodospirillaceae bacterium]